MVGGDLDCRLGNFDEKRLIFVDEKRQIFVVL